MEYYTDRELSLLKFHKRVLGQAADTSVPIFERLRFCSIFCSNLDEFFMIRVGRISEASKNSKYSAEYRAQQKKKLSLIQNEVRPLYTEKDDCLNSVENELASYGILRISPDSAEKEQCRQLRRIFKKSIFPLLSPQIIDSRHPFPHLENKKLYIFVMLGGKKDTHSSASHFGIIPASGVFERLFVLPESGGFVLAEELILKYASEIFKGCGISARAIVRITRNADIDPEDEYCDDESDFRICVSDALKKRGRLSPVRIEFYTGKYQKSKKLLKYICEHIGLSSDFCFRSSSPLDMGYINILESMIQMEGQNKKELFYLPLPPIKRSFQSVISAVRKKDILLSYPFQSMHTYLQLLEEAADSDETVSIKITLYRLSKDSEVAKLLCRAAENGKEVTVLLELKARFDEDNNIFWSRKLEAAGCRVIYGIEGLKVHSKITLITCLSADGIYRIAQIGTGNYNEKTARQYTDLAMITSDRRITDDADRFFRCMTIGNAKTDCRYLWTAPFSLKNNIIAKIREQALLGPDGYIFMKMNGLCDRNIIDELILASAAGVKTDLAVRGICCLIPGIKGVTENIRVISIVGRFLEHSRFFIFGNDDCFSAYIGSADMMPRNTMARVEILAPVFDRDIAETLRQMSRTILSDNVKASVLQSDGSYVPCRSDLEKLDSQIYFYNQSKASVNPHSIFHERKLSIYESRRDHDKRI